MLVSRAAGMLPVGAGGVTSASSLESGCCRMAPIHDWLDTLASLYGRYGYALVFWGALGENTALLGLFLPGNMLALLGGFYAREGKLSLPVVILLTWCGTVLGYHLDYALGRLVLGHFVQGWQTAQLGRRLRLAGRLRLARAFLHRHGGKAILVSHLVGQLRSFVALGAGMSHMPYRRFLRFEAMAALLWSGGLSLAGYLVGGERKRLEVFIARSGWLILGLLVLVYVAWRVVRPRLRVHARRWMRRHERGVARVEADAGDMEERDCKGAAQR